MMKIKFVYLIKSGPFVKVGFSRNPERRLYELNRLLPQRPELLATFIGSVALENKIHRFLRAHHMRGEWFHFCPAIEEIIANGLPDLSGLPAGSPFYPGRNSPEYKAFKGRVFPC